MCDKTQIYGNGTKMSAFMKDLRPKKVQLMPAVISLESFVFPFAA
jgi:hypothetical protein